jgi:hypothetical protein
MSEKPNRQKLAEFIFDSLDRDQKGFLSMTDFQNSLHHINDSNQPVVKKYLSWYFSSSQSDSISRSDFINLLLSKKKQPVIVHVNLSDLLIFTSPSKIARTFSQRLKRRLDIDKFKTQMEEPSENSLISLKDCCKDQNHCEKPRWKSAKQRNLEELLSIRRCHLLYS